MSRRRFVRRSAEAFATAALASQTRLFPRAAEPAASGKSIHLALLSDTHIPADRKGGEHRKFLPWENLKAVVPQVIQARPEGVILNGDAARLTGELGDYQELKYLLGPLAAVAPIYIGLGNHDHRENFAKIFYQHPGERQEVKDKHVLIMEWPAVRLILLDSLLYVDRVAGLLGKVQREWLAQYLEKSDQRATVLFVHHTLGDADGDLLDTERLFRLVRPHKQVKAIFYGHSHKYAFAEEAGIQLVNLPAVGYNFEDAEPVGWVDARFTAEGADLTLKAFGGNQSGDGKTTSVAWKR
ncbi:MAG: metallophosphoesterase [Verrucomicrobia bacterium]|nr:metallophosphoesterase [Verrucomicrobiota bacterium]